jgi:hypothetical protein
MSGSTDGTGKRHPLGSETTGLESMNDRPLYSCALVT